MTGLISIIVPAYNAEKYLAQCLDSLLKQTYKKLEIIVIDDGSSDSTPEILDAYAAKHRQIVAIHQKNGGVSAARNAGLDAATGEYIHFCDADDWMHEDAYKICMELMKEHEPDMVSFNSILHTEDGNESLRIQLLPTGMYNRMGLIKNAFGYIAHHNKVVTNYLCMTNKLIKASLLYRKDGTPIRFRLGMRYLEDGLLFTEVAANVNRYYYDSRGLYYHRRHEDSVMATHDLESLTNNMLNGYEALMASPYIATNPMANQYAYAAYYRAARYYARLCYEEDQQQLLERILYRFQNDVAFMADIQKYLQPKEAESV